MKIAIPIWNGRVSPVMDTASQLLILKIQNGREMSRSVLPIPKMDIIQRARFITNVEIDLLICGALSRPFENALSHHGLSIYPWIKGDIDEIITAYLKGNLLKNEFNLPGCRGRCRRGRRQEQNRRGYGLKVRNNSKEDI